MIKYLKAAAAGVVLAGLLAVNVSAQGPYSAQITAALRAFLTQAHTWTGVQTFSGGTVTLAASGCGTIPYSFSGDATTGMCQNAAGAVDFYTANFNKMRINSGGIHIGAQALLLGTSVSSDDLQIYRSAAKTLKIDTDGAGGAITLIDLKGPIAETFGSSAAASYSFTGALNHGMYMAGGTNGPVIVANGVDDWWCSAAPYCQMRSDGAIKWSANTTITTTADTAISHPAAGNVLLSGVSAPMQFRTTQTTVPTCTTNCGTPNNVCAGTDTDMTCTMGTTPASGFVINFNGTWVAAPSCTGAMALTGMAVGKLPMVLVTTTTTLTVTTNGVAPATSDKYHFHCMGIQ